MQKRWVAFSLMVFFFLFVGCSSTDPGEEELSSEWDESSEGLFSEENPWSSQGWSSDLPWSSGGLSSSDGMSSGGLSSDVELSSSSFEGGECLVGTGDYAIYQLISDGQLAGKSGEDAVQQVIGSLKSGVTAEQRRTQPYCSAKIVREAMKIEEPGDYFATGAMVGKINIKVAGVHLFLSDAQLSNPGKEVIESDEDYVLTLLGSNSVSNQGTGEEPESAINGKGSITINGTGSLSIVSNKSGIRSDKILTMLGGSVTVKSENHGVSSDVLYLDGAKVDITSAGKDGLHSENGEGVTQFYYNHGLTYITGSSVVKGTNILGDGAHADSFFAMDGGDVDLETVPTWKNATTKDGCYKKSGNTYYKVSAEDLYSLTGAYQLLYSNKGIRAGQIQYTPTGSSTKVTVASNNYLIWINGGTIDLNTTDDAIHANSGDVIVRGGNVMATTLDDGVHGDNSVIVSGGEVTVKSSYEGVEGTKVLISGGVVKAKASDDGINAANASLSTAQQLTNCLIEVSGGKVYVDAQGDGVDSNGKLISSGGELYVAGPSAGMNGALDSEPMGNEQTMMNGGVVIAVGTAQMPGVPHKSSTSYSLIKSLGTQKGKVTIKQGSTELMSFDPMAIFGVEKNYGHIVASHPSLTSGVSYTIVTGNNSTTATATK